MKAAMLGCSWTQALPGRRADHLRQARLRDHPAASCHAATCHHGCKTYPACSIRLPDNRFRLEIADKIDLPAGPTA
jgi:hypothetical protein